MSDMLPCPFCGGEAEIVERGSRNCFGDETTTLTAHCALCGAEPYKTVLRDLHYQSNWRYVLETAVFELKEKWNKREEA